MNAGWRLLSAPWTQVASLRRTYVCACSCSGFFLEIWQEKLHFGYTVRFLHPVVIG